MTEQHKELLKAPFTAIFVDAETRKPMAQVSLSFVPEPRARFRMKEGEETYTVVEKVVQLEPAALIVYLQKDRLPVWRVAQQDG